ncbi:MAG TPA: DUF4340 domain-containing protein, partial [Caldilineaceae bacterium]|nr:DUF4340 domain-containing protein [Caldilineaceae bacterium]
MSDLNIPSESLSPARARRLPLNRLNLALAVVLVIQTALAVVVYWPRTTSGGGEALLPDVTAEEVTSLRIADAEGNEVVLERGEEGWTLAGTDGYPANEEKINTSLDKLLALNGDRLVTQTAASHKQLQVAEDDFVRRITLNAGGDEYTLYLGSSAGAGATHLRLAGNDATYLTSEVA